MRLTTTATAEELATEYGRAIAADPMQAKLRFGQWVCNQYLPTGESWPEVFYGNNPRVFAMLAQRPSHE